MGPVAHASIGILGWKLSPDFGRKGTGLLFIIIAGLPDIDFLLHFLINSEKPVHQLYTHNIFFCTLSALLILRVFKPAREYPLLILMVANSHLILDLLVIDKIEPIGIRILYPLLSKPVNLGLWPHLLRDGWRQILSLHNLFVFLLECVIFMVPILIIIRVKEQKRFRT